MLKGGDMFILSLHYVKSLGREEQVLIGFRHVDCDTRIKKGRREGTTGKERSGIGFW